MGNFDSFSQSTARPVGEFRYNQLEFYVQDTWKVTREFTVTLGVRMGLEPPVHEVNGQQASTNLPLAAWLLLRGVNTAVWETRSIVRGAPA